MQDALTLPDWKVGKVIVVRYPNGVTEIERDGVVFTVNDKPK